MSKFVRFVVIISFLYIFCCLNINNSAADDANNSTDLIKAPVGLVGSSELTSVELVWVNAPEFEGTVEGYFVYYWQTDQGIYNIKQANENLLTEQKLVITELRPGTSYSFVVRAATKQDSETLEKQGDYYLSKLSNEYSIQTKTDIKLKLAMSNVEGALVEVQKYVPRSSKWYTQSFYTRMGSEIGEVRKVDDFEIDFRTGYILKEIRTKTITNDASASSEFADPRDANNKITLPEKVPEGKSGVVLEAVLIDSNGSKIILKKLN